MNLPELIKASGHDWNTPFAEIVKKESFVSELYKMHYQKEIEEAPDKQAFLESKIELFSSFFSNGIAHDFFERMADVKDLLRLGFNLQRNTPKAKFCDIVSSKHFRDEVFEFGKNNKIVKGLCEISHEFKIKFQGERISSLDIDEINFEAFHYVIIGGNFAMVYKFLKDYSLNKERPKSISSNLITYKWEGRQSEVRELYKELIGALIVEKTTFQDFELIFTGISANEILNPIRWHDDNATEALYLIRALSDGVISNDGDKHKRFARCIVRPDGSEFVDDLKSLYSKCHRPKQLDPNKKQLIDTIVSKFK